MRDPSEGITVNKIGAMLEIPHELLLDSGTHQCDESCPPPWVPSRTPLKRRVLNRLRSFGRVIRQLPEYRIVHKNDVWDGWSE